MRFETTPLTHQLCHGIGTLFSMAALSFVVSIVLDLMVNIAAALWAGNALQNILDMSGAAGLTTQAMQQGGIGLMMTVLLISAPPMAASFFGGAVGQFYFQSAFGGGPGARQMPDGQQSPYSPGANHPPSQPSGQASTNATTAPYGSGGNPGNRSSEPPRDEMRTYASSSTPPNKQLKVDGESK